MSLSMADLIEEMARIEAAHASPPGPDAPVAGVWR